MLAIDKDQVECIEILITAGADASFYFHRSARERDYGILMYLISIGFDPETRDEDGYTPMDYAQLYGVRGMVDQLIMMKKPYKAPTTKETRHLLDVSRKKYEDHGNAMIRRNRIQFIPKHDDGHYRDENGWTILHHRAAEGDEESVNKLIDAFLVGRDVIANDGSTPADVAEKAGYQQLAENLRQPSHKNFGLAVTIAQKHLDEYNTLLKTLNEKMDEAHFIPQLTDRIKKCFNEGREVDKHDLYDLLMHTITQSDNVEDVLKLVKLGCPVSPFGEKEESVLKVAINMDRNRIVSALIALGSDIFFRVGGRGILRYTWITPAITIYTKMIITRFTYHQITKDKNHTEKNSNLEVIALKMLESVNENPEKTEISQKLLTQLKIYQGRTLTSLLCEAIDKKCPYLASLLYDAGAKTYTHSNIGKTALHHSLDAQSGMEKFILTHHGGSLYVSDTNGRKPVDYMQGDLKKDLEKKIAKLEYVKLYSSLSSTKDDMERSKMKSLILLFGCLNVTFGDPEDIVSWRELYAFTNQEMLRTIDPDNASDKLTWIRRLCKQIIEQLLTDESTDILENEQQSYEELFYFLNKLKQKITRLSDNKYKLQLRTGEPILNIPDASGVLNRALEYTCKRKYNLFMHMLVYHAQVNPSSPIDNQLQTYALHHAAAKGNECAVAYLLHTCNVKIDAVDVFGNTAAHHAYIFGHIHTGDYITYDNENLRLMDNSSRRNPRDLLEAYENRVKNLKELLMEDREEVKEKLLDVQDQTNELSLATLLMDLCITRKHMRMKTFAELSQEYLVDFSKGENKIIFNEVLRFTKRIGKYISRKNKYFKGTLIPAGSAAEGCRLGTPDECDFNWVLHWSKIIKAILTEMSPDQQADKGYSHMIELDSQNQEIRRLLTASNLVDDFYCAVKEAITALLNFDDIRLSVILAGVRQTCVGVAFTLGWMGFEHKLLLVDVDLVPVIKAARPDGYSHPPLTAHITGGAQPITHTISIANYKRVFNSNDLNAVYINSMGDEAWRFSQTLEESFVMLNLNEDRKTVFRISKYLVSVLKAEPWYPQDIRKRYSYFNDKSFKLPAPQGFLLKSSFFMELQRVSDDEYWKKKWYLIRIKSIFLHMCRENKERDDIMDSLRPETNKVDTEVLECGLVSSYFAKSSQKQILGYMAPTILKILNNLQIKDFVNR